MSGEEKIVAVKNAVEHCISEKVWTYKHSGREWTDVREGYENGSGKSEKSNAFHCKRHIINASHAYKNAHDEQNYRAPHKNSVYLVDSYITQHNICDGITGSTSGIIARHKLGEKTAAQQKKAGEKWD